MSKNVPSPVVSNLCEEVNIPAPVILDLRQENKRVNDDHAVLPLSLAKLALKAWHDSLLTMTFGTRLTNLTDSLFSCKNEDELITVMEEELYAAKLKRAIANNDYESFEVHV